VSEWPDLLARVAQIVAADRDRIESRPVDASASLDELRAAFGGPVPATGTGALALIEEIAAAAAPGVVASAGPRYFGFVIGGSHPAALAADWLTSGWDNNIGLYVAGPAPAVMEEVAGRWMVELLGLPPESSVGFATGATMASFSGLAAARHRVLADTGWDVEADGLQGAPRLRVIVGAERHATIDVALRYLGIGAGTVEVVPVDGQGRMATGELAGVLAAGEPGPTIICAQAGNVNTGAADPFGEICDLAAEIGAWVHVDGAFGLWAAATDDLTAQVAGAARADSWSVDAHKWLNVPYDCGVVVCRHPADHRAALGVEAAYLVQGGAGAPRDGLDWAPEFSRRGRGVPVYAAIRALGRDGIARVVSGCCAHARRFAAALGSEPGVEILNDVVLNQVLVRFDDSDDRTRAVIDGVQADGTCWAGGTVWQGRAAMRISVSNWTTTETDVDQSVAAMLRVHQSLG